MNQTFLHGQRHRERRNICIKHDCRQHNVRTASPSHSPCPAEALEDVDKIYREIDPQLHNELPRTGCLLGVEASEKRNTGGDVAQSVETSADPDACNVRIDRQLVAGSQRMLRRRNNRELPHGQGKHRHPGDRKGEKQGFSLPGVRRRCYRYR